MARARAWFRALCGEVSSNFGRQERSSIKPNASTSFQSPRKFTDHSSEARETGL